MIQRMVTNMHPGYLETDTSLNEGRSLRKKKMHSADEIIKILNTKNERPGRQLLRYNTQNMKISYLCRIAMNYTHFRCIQIFCNLLSGF